MVIDKKWCIDIMITAVFNDGGFEFETYERFADVKNVIQYLFEREGLTAFDLLDPAHKDGLKVFYIDGIKFISLWDYYPKWKELKLDRPKREFDCKVLSFSIHGIKTMDVPRNLLQYFVADGICAMPIEKVLPVEGNIKVLNFDVDGGIVVRLIYEGEQLAQIREVIKIKRLESQISQISPLIDVAINGLSKKGRISAAKTAIKQIKALLPK